MIISRFVDVASTAHKGSKEGGGLDKGLARHALCCHLVLPGLAQSKPNWACTGDAHAELDGSTMPVWPAPEAPLCSSPGAWDGEGEILLCLDAPETGRKPKIILFRDSHLIMRAAGKNGVGSRGEKTA